MPTTRETILSALAHDIEAGLSAVFYRNRQLPAKIPELGLVIMDDGEPGEPIEVTLSPLRYHYQHAVELIVVVQSAAGREGTIDTIFAEIGAVIAADRTLGGRCDWIETGGPVPTELPLDGGETMLAASVPLILHYAVSDALA